MKFLFFVVFLIVSAGLFAAPLEAGFAQAPRTVASAEEREAAFSQARRKVIEAAVKYEGTPYLYGGMTSRGLDCSGFIGLSFKDALGVVLPRSASGIYTWSERIPREKAQPGDLLFFRTTGNGLITHVGLYLGNGSFIHSASAGPRTGVIYSNLSETYWSRTFAGAGRAFPEAAPGFQPTFSNTIPASSSTPSRSGSSSNSGWGGANTGSPPVKNKSSADGSGKLFLGAAFAPTWNGFLKSGDFFRGFSSQLCLVAETYSFGPKMLFGLALRPEYDHALGVFRLPLTFSWGPSEKFMIFAGPVVSFGDASIETEDGVRHYSGGTSWLGAIGITAAPFIFDSSQGRFAPYFELAWQNYYNDSSASNLNADFSAGFRFSTGLRWTVQVK